MSDKRQRWLAKQAAKRKAAARGRGPTPPSRKHWIMGRELWSPEARAWRAYRLAARAAGCR